MKEYIYTQKAKQHEALLNDADYFVRENSEDWITRTTGQLPSNEALAR